ncbi:MAG: GDP-mannose 4,6-dehydratase [Chloroflexota bacterium]
MKRVLVTGAAGFVGGHLIRRLAADPASAIFGVTRRARPSTASDGSTDAACHWIVGDLLDPALVDRAVAESRPDWVVHLAAQASVVTSWQDPAETWRNNTMPQISLLDSVARHAPTARILIAGSSEEYGQVRLEDPPLAEDAPLRPTSPYAASKVAQDYLGLQYHLGRNLDVRCVRPFNLLGPGQSDRFAIPSFARQIAEAEAGWREPIIRVGNLGARRDFTDVRDAVQAYELLLESGRAGGVYNVGGGCVRSIQEILEVLCALASRDLKIQVDPARFRPADATIVRSDCRKIREAVGWAPTTPIDRTLRDILDEWRRRVAA